MLTFLSAAAPLTKTEIGVRCEDRGSGHGYFFYEYNSVNTSFHRVHRKLTRSLKKMSLFMSPDNQTTSWTVGECLRCTRTLPGHHTAGWLALTEYQLHVGPRNYQVECKFADPKLLSTDCRACRAEIVKNRKILRPSNSPEVSYRKQG